MGYGHALCAVAALLLGTLALRADESQGPGDPKFDKEAVERGHQLLIAQCGFCHGSNARGASGGPDLTRSPLVQEDEGGKQLGEFLKVGRPDRNMPPFELTDQEVSDLATYLHSTITAAINRGDYKILDILVGDPKAGEAFFHGAGKCSSCHSPAGDLKGIGAKYDPVTLQGRIVMPPRHRPSPQSGEPATASVSVSERDQGHGNRAVGPVVDGYTRAPDRLRRHAVRSRVGAEAVVAAEWRLAESRSERSAAGAHGHAHEVDR